MRFASLLVRHGRRPDSSSPTSLLPLASLDLDLDPLQLSIDSYLLSGEDGSAYDSSELMLGRLSLDDDRARDGRAEGSKRAGSRLAVPLCSQGQDFQLFDTAGGGEYTSLYESPSNDLELLPDLIPDTSPSIFLSRCDRSSSAPLLTHKKPPRRRTLESRDQQSFIPTLYARSISGSSDESIASSDLGAGIGASGVGGIGIGIGGGGKGSGGGPYWNPHTDHPLSRSEQEDLLDRVRRDLLGVDLDTLQGPLRALALSASHSSSRSTPPLAYENNNAPHQLLHSLPISTATLLAQEEQDQESMRRTVSPQEAFLDYDSVDHQLHSNPRLSSSFGVGVGTSLFAPLPVSTINNDSSRPPSPRSPKITGPQSPTRASAYPHQFTHSRRRSHPFSVPKNAVSWVEKNEVGMQGGEGVDLGEGAGMVDFSERLSDGEEELIIAIRKRNGKANATRNAYENGRGHPFSDSGRSEAPVASGSGSERGDVNSETLSARLRQSSLPPLPPLPMEVSRPPSDVSNDLESLNDDSSDEYLPEAPPLSTHSPNHARHTPALSEATSVDASSVTSQGSSHPKRSRASNNPFEDDDFDYDSSLSDQPITATKTTQHPKKKRKTKAILPINPLKIAPPGGIISPTTGLTVCSFLYDDKSMCGVEFRRPYDLARHRETIHGEGKGLKKGIVVEWICESCQGVFSRKDALIRHARIRGHVAGV